MTEKPTYEMRIQEILDYIDSQIEVLKHEMKSIPDTDSERYSDAINFLVSNREAMRRGLLTPGRAFDRADVKE